MRYDRIISKFETLKKRQRKEQAEFIRKIFKDEIIPYCKTRKLSYVTVNGTPRLINLDNTFVRLPTALLKLCDVQDMDDNPLLWHIQEDFYFSPRVDVNEADRKRWNSQNKSCFIMRI